LDASPIFWTPGSAGDIRRKRSLNIWRGHHPAAGALG
jgi:hypothetical protein